MILYESEDEYKLEVLNRDSWLNHGLLDANKRMQDYIDPKGMLSTHKYSVSDGLPPVLSDEDYVYIKKSIKRLQKVREEIIDLCDRFDPVCNPSHAATKSGVLLAGIESCMFSFINYTLFQDAHRMLSIIPSTWADIITSMSGAYNRYVSRSRCSYGEYTNRVQPIRFQIRRKFVDCSDAEANKFILELKEAGVELGNKNESTLYKKINFDLCEDALMVGWFDEFSKLLPKNKLIKEYKKKLCSKDSLSKFDLATLLYCSDIKGGSIQDFMGESVASLLSIFWNNVDKIKESLVHESILLTPPFVVNTFWSMFQD